MYKRRRNDEGLVDDREISDYLDDHPNLYKIIQLGAVIKKSPDVEINCFGGINGLVTSIFDSIKNIILRLFPDIKFHNGNGKSGFDFGEIDGKTYYTIWMLKPDLEDEELYNLFKIINDDMSVYLRDLSEYVLKITGFPVEITMSESDENSFSILFLQGNKFFQTLE